MCKCARQWFLVSYFDRHAVQIRRFAFRGNISWCVPYVLAHMLVCMRMNRTDDYSLHVHDPHVRFSVVSILPLVGAMCPFVCGTSVSFLLQQESHMMRGVRCLLESFSLG